MLALITGASDGIGKQKNTNHPKAQFFISNFECSRRL